MSNLIWTNHVIQRNNERKIPESFINQTFSKPDSSLQKEDRKTEYRKRFASQTVTLITKNNEHGETLLLSAWIDPPNRGTADYKKKENYNKMKNGSGIRKIWITLRSQIGL